MLKTLTELLAASGNGPMPKRLAAIRDDVPDAYDKFLKYIATENSPPVYGVNLQVGHRVAEGRKRVFDSGEQMMLLRSHAMGSAPYYDDVTASCIGYAKAFSVAAGGSLISPQLFDHMKTALADETFRPRIPRGASYSCGDVIPGAHWALDLLNYQPSKKARYELQPGEALALVNGSFVHVGFAASRSRKIYRALALYCEITQAVVRLTRQPSDIAQFCASDAGTNASAALGYIFEHQSPSDVSFVQPPVSIRTIGQCLEAYSVAAQNFVETIDGSIDRPVNNPLFSRFEGAFKPLPSGSFLVPALTIATSAMIEAVLLLSWTTVSHSHFLHRGHEGLPLDFATKKQPFGSVQRPKFMQAMLEDVRKRASARSFASGSATSYGEEDLWSFGVSTTDILDDALTTFEDLLLEHAISVSEASVLSKRKKIVPDHLRQVCLDPELAKGARLESVLEWSQENAAVPLQETFPVPLQV